MTDATREPVQEHLISEINEQPRVLAHLLDLYVHDGHVTFPDIGLTDDDLVGVERIHIVACGTSYHAGLIAKALVEQWVRIPVEVDVASEFNYRDVLTVPNTLYIVITQSGTTADTIISLRRILSWGAPVVAITNVVGVTIPDEATGFIHTDAGPEYSVAATKSFTAQLGTLVLLALDLAALKGTLTQEEVASKLEELARMPELIQQTIDSTTSQDAPAMHMRERASAMFMGRGLLAALAKEGALKLKETSYLHAEAYPAGEIKHGPLALIESGFPMVSIVSDDHTHDKTLHNMEEYKSNGAYLVAVAPEGDEKVSAVADHTFFVPRVPSFLEPFVAVIPLQFLARAVSIARGNVVDEPRNLSKSVTAE